MAPQSLPEPTDPQAPERLTADDVARRVAWRMRQEVLTPGDIASLRRADDEQRDFGGVLWKIVAEDLEPHGLVPRSEEAAREAIGRWRVVLAAVARLHVLQQDRRSLGAALASAKVSEMRLLRLLRADDLETLQGALRAVTHQLSSAGEPVDVGDVATLVDSMGRVRSADFRRRVARAYYGQLRRMEASEA